jgi:asparagine synthase (glutamine-hydrolysing)
MCGVAGLVCLTDQCREEEHVALVKKLSGLQRHRGPDDEGVVSLGKVCLGSVRLSIIDLSEAGHMPMANQNGRWWISYNGEVYNFKDLRDDLIRCGHSFRSKTDTEVVLHAFEEWGEDSISRFVGMFAFAAYDRQGNTLTLVRDRFGIKPLYYMLVEGHVFFASEMKALIQVGSSLKINKQRLIEWCLYRNVDVLNPETLVEHIYSVLPGHVVTIQNGQISSRCYYSPPLQVEQELYDRNHKLGATEVIAELDGLLHQSITDRLVSDVPVGTLCSGGLDSSLITSVAARHHQQITAFHVSVSGYPGLDEKAYAEAVTRSLGLRLISHSLTGEGFRRELPRAIYLSDVPLTYPNSVAFSLICQVARDNGVIVLLSGEGADELFGGYAWRYRRYRNFLRARRFLSLLPAKLRRGIQTAGYACDGMPGNSFRFNELLPHTVSFIDKYARREWSQRCEDAYHFVSNPFDRSVLGATLGDLNDFLTSLLRRLDRMSMGASVECRVPFLDHRLVKKVINLPLHYRLNRSSDKWVLKQVATRYLPSKILNRKKAGFPLPFYDYLAPLADARLFDKGFCTENLGLHPKGVQEVVASRRHHVQAFFNLISLEIWGRLFFLRETPEQLTELITRSERNSSVSR